MSRSMGRRGAGPGLLRRDGWVVSPPSSSPTPASILGALLNVEYRANDPLITVAAGRVSTWPAFNAGSGDLVQGTAGNQPAYSATGYRSLYPGVTCDTGVRQMRATLTVEIGAPYQPYCFILGNHTLTAGIRNVMYVGSTTGPFTEFCNLSRSGAKHAIGDAVTTEISAVAVDTNPHLFEWARRDSTQPCIRIDGVDAFTPAASNAGTLPLGFVQIGNTASTAAQFTFAHIVVCNSRPSAQQLTDMRTYFATAYP